jgi:hypothetical protein
MTIMTFNLQNIMPQCEDLCTDGQGVCGALHAFSEMNDEMPEKQ